MKKLVAVCMALVMALGLAACGGSGSSAPASASVAGSTGSSAPEAKPVEIRVVTSYGGDDGNRANYEEAVAGYEAATGNTVVDESATSNEQWKAQVKADFQTGSVDQGMRTIGPQCIHYRGFSTKNGVILLFFAIAIAIQNHQYHRFFRNRHCDNLILKSQNLRNFTTAESIK